MSDTVTVACKLPHGLELRIFRESMIDEPIQGGGTRKVKMYHPLPNSVTINGNAHPQNAAPKSPIVDGFALTYGVPKDFWDQWLAANKDSDMVRNGLVFAHVQQRSVEAEAKEKANVRSGLERLDPKNLPREFRNKIETAARQ